MASETRRKLLVLEALKGGKLKSGPDLFGLYTHALAAETTSGNSGDVSLSGIDLLNILIHVTALTGTTPTVQFFFETKDAAGNYYPIWTGVSRSVATDEVVGVGPATPNNIPFTDVGRLRWVLGGTTPSCTFVGSVNGRKLEAAAGAA